MNVIGKNHDNGTTYLGHLDALRSHLIRAMIVLMVFTIGAFLVAPWIFEHIIFAPARPGFITFRALCRIGMWVGSDGLCVEAISLKFQSRYMTGQFSMHLMASVITGLVLTFPYIAWELWRFIRPGLYQHERQSSRGAVGAVSFLFAVGLLFGFFVLAPVMISFLANYTISDLIVNEFDITSYVATVVGIVFAAGLLFQLPVVIYFLSSMGIVTPQSLRLFRKKAIIGILIIGAVITPTSDPLSQSLLAIPLYLLYELSIVLSARVWRRKQIAEAEAAASSSSEVFIRKAG